MFKLELIGGFNPFEWDDFKCPVCKGKEFDSMSHSGVYCDDCGAQFVVRMTAGDPGCVVDCLVEGIYAPCWCCKECSTKKAFLDGDPPICPTDFHHEMEREEYIYYPWSRPEGYPKSFCLILKLGDYCSGWLRPDKGVKSLGFPTQAQWDKFQENLRLNGQLGVNIHSRYMLIHK